MSERDKEATADTLVFDRFRERESLNGEWNYAIDQYNAFMLGRRIR